jgi:hypothetical protein
MADLATVMRWRVVQAMQEDGFDKRIILAVIIGYFDVFADLSRKPLE